MVHGFRALCDVSEWYDGPWIPCIMWRYWVIWWSMDSVHYVTLLSDMMVHGFRALCDVSEWYDSPWIPCIMFGGFCIILCIQYDKVKFTKNILLCMKIVTPLDEDRALTVDKTMLWHHSKIIHILDIKQNIEWIKRQCEDNKLIIKRR